MIQHKRRGLTKIELLIVVAIVAAIVGLTVPAAMKVRQSQLRAQSTDNLKQIGLAFHGFDDVHKRMPFPGGLTATVLANNPALGDPRTGTWAYQILPFIGQTELFNAPPSIPGGGNSQNRTVGIPTLMCPARGRRSVGQTGFANCPQAAWSDYVINGLINDPTTDEKKKKKTMGMVMVPGPTPDDPNPNGDTKHSLRWIGDGWNTILVGQAMIQRGDWPNPADASAPDGASQCSDIYLLSAANGSGPVTTNRLSRSVGPWNDAMGGYPVVVQPDAPGHSDSDITKWGGPFSQGYLVCYWDATVWFRSYPDPETINRAGVGKEHSFSGRLTPNGGEDPELGDY